MKAFVIGGAGFIGSNLVDRLLSLGHDVTVFDNLSTGIPIFLESAKVYPNYNFIQGNILDSAALNRAIIRSDLIFMFNLSANADIRAGTIHPENELKQIIATFHVLEAMRKNAIKNIVFCSTGAIYGNAAHIPTPENCPFPVQTSLYSASKLASEGLIEAYCEGYEMQSWIFRPVSILGERYSHGHIVDFYKKLLVNPEELFVLGDGNQKKSYLYVQDFLDGVFCALTEAHDHVNILNLGTDEYIELNNSIDLLTEFLNIKPTIRYSGGDRGWIGDNPFIFLDCKKIRKLGWRPNFSIKESVIKTLQWLQKNEWLLQNSFF